MPRVPYKIDGVRVTGATTIISRFKDSEALKIWSNNLGLKGINYFEELKRVQTLVLLFTIMLNLTLLKKNLLYLMTQKFKVVFVGS